MCPSGHLGICVISVHALPHPAGLPITYEKQKTYARVDGPCSLATTGSTASPCMDSSRRLEKGLPLKSVIGSPGSLSHAASASTECTTSVIPGHASCQR